MLLPVLFGIASAPVETLKVWHCSHISHGFTVYDTGIRCKRDLNAGSWIVCRNKKTKAGQGDSPQMRRKAVHRKWTGSRYRPADGPGTPRNADVGAGVVGRGMSEETPMARHIGHTSPFGDG